MIHVHLDGIKDIEAVIEKEVKRGRVIGLSKYNGKKVVILVPHDQEEPEEMQVKKQDNSETFGTVRKTQK